MLLIGGLGIPELAILALVAALVLFSQWVLKGLPTLGTRLLFVMSTVVLFVLVIVATSLGLN